MKRKAFVVWRGEVRGLEVFDSAAEASKAKGGAACWLVVSKHAKGSRYLQDVIVPGVKRERGLDRRTEYYYTNELGEDQFAQYAKAFPTFAAAKRFLVKCARSDLKRERDQYLWAAAELTRLQHMKPPAKVRK